jgi:hypothetical protein
VTALTPLSSGDDIVSYSSVVGLTGHLPEHKVVGVYKVMNPLILSRFFTARAATPVPDASTFHGFVPVTVTSCQIALRAGFQHVPGSDRGVTVFASAVSALTAMPNAAALLCVEFATGAVQVTAAPPSSDVLRASTTSVFGAQFYRPSIPGASPAECETKAVWTVFNANAVLPRFSLDVEKKAIY